MRKVMAKSSNEQKSTYNVYQAYDQISLRAMI